ncbi:hypothetical protein KAT55_07235 [Candidatus Bathyarchaeota archaeon]|nr:hypothetical protein [Candidatus Bathyarchaeota archaeon]
MRGIRELVEEKGSTKIRDISTNLGVSPARAEETTSKTVHISRVYFVFRLVG